jgi:ketosteroid isomerase-like protein
MNRAFLLLLAFCSFAFAADQVEAVREAAVGWRQGAVKQDKTALQKFLADDLVYTHGSGKRQTKAEYITDVTQGPPHYESFNPTGTNIRVYGKVAVVVGLVDVSPAKGEPYRVKTFEVYTQNSGQWQLVQKESARLSK